MPIPYPERRRRRQKLSEELPPALRGRIALRNVEEVAKLPLDSQQTLAEVLDVGVKISAAICYIKENPTARVDEVIRVCQKSKNKHEHNVASSNEISPNIHDLTGSSRQAINELTDVLQFCFPDMPGMTADAMARAEFLSGVLNLLRAQRNCLEARYVESDLVFVVLCGLVQKTIIQLNKLIHTKPVYKQALRQSGVDWPGID
jgi:hypothetical protein